MGRDYEREDSSVSTKLTYLIIGGGIGAVIALLFAPKSGKELREDIATLIAKLNRSNLSAEEGMRHAKSLADAYDILKDLE